MVDVYGGSVDESWERDSRHERDFERERLPVRAPVRERRHVPRCRHCGGRIGEPFVLGGVAYDVDHSECRKSDGDIRSEQLELFAGGES